MARLKEKLLYTVDEYLEIERESEERHEYMALHANQYIGCEFAHHFYRLHDFGE